MNSHEECSVCKSRGPLLAQRCAKCLAWFVVHFMRAVRHDAGIETINCRCVILPIVGKPT